MPGSDSSSYFLTDEPGSDVTGKKQMVREEHVSGYKVDFLTNIFKSIALLQSFNLYERNTGTNKEIPKPKVELSKVSYKKPLYVVVTALQ